MTKINIKKSTTTTIVASLIIGLIMLSPMTILPNINAQQSQMPANAIRTPNGGWVTPLKTHDDKGNPLTIHYEIGQIVHPKELPTILGPSTGLYQEGTNNWTYSESSDPLSIGFETTWTMPTGSITNTTYNGLYYNPVNFYYNGATTGATYPYTFFQVDWGIGGGGVQTNWFYSMFYKSGGVWQSPTTVSMSSVPVSQGSTYTVQSAIEPTNLANPPSYVVEVTKGQQSWLYSTSLTYTPQIGYIYQLQSYQDEYVKGHGSDTFSSDKVTSPTVVLDNNGNTGYDSSHISGNSNYNTNNTTCPNCNTYTTYGILAPSGTGTTLQDVALSPQSW
ncbi:MAG: hypothetical protein ACREA3_07740 [Nitrosotalea sp.]